MPTIYIMVALPRSGKSTYVAQHFGALPKVSADQLRLLIHGRRFWAEKEHEVWRVRDIMLKALMEQQLDVVIDETNVTRKNRRPMLKLARTYGYNAVAIVINTPVEICKQRAIQSNQEDLLPVIEEMAQRYEAVTEEEGFVQVIRVD
ncbi:putative kinase [Caldalkalibacillus uzonensis]|uniref:Kinase n=1 Tax=Caldalkalibacillus uzonensis TaxID=353224 RepID=A0ABU0CUB0_9BACI|nr:AAA family ATPase [Caldalkalibacillus uzonensis]MDQ0339693.1 putative kinase [Caldalkalibacillus uzonensis]